MFIFLKFVPKFCSIYYVPCVIGATKTKLACGSLWLILLKSVCVVSYMEPQKTTGPGTEIII